MKNKIALIFLCISFLFANVAQANIISVISQENTISGDGYLMYTFPPPGGPYLLLDKSFSITSNSSSVSQEIYGQGDTGSPPITIGTYRVNASANSEVTSSSLRMGISVSADDESGAYSIGSALSSITFSPLVTYIKTTFEVNDFGQPSTFSLFDVTDGISLLPSASDPIWNDYGMHSINSFVDPSHIYTLSMRFDDVSFNHMEYAVEITDPPPPQAVPEPSMLYFLGLGLAGLAAKLYSMRRINMAPKAV